MRRHLLAAMLAGATLAVAASPAIAVAHTFTGSESAAPKFAGETEEFVLKPFTVSCEAAKSSKTSTPPTFPTSSLLAEVKFSKCSATATLGGTGEHELKARFAAPVDINFHANGYVEIGSGGKVTAGKLEGAQPIEILFSGEFKCSVDIEPGIFPLKAEKRPEETYEAAKYTPEEVTVQKGKKVVVKHKLAIALALSKMPYEIEGEFCETFSKTEGKAGSYTGKLLAELPKGNLGWE